MWKGNHRLTARVFAGIGAAIVLAAGCQFAVPEPNHWDLPDGNPWFCASTNVTPHAGEHNHEDAAHPAQPKGPLSAADCKILTAQIGLAVESTQPFASVRSAIKAGWFGIREYSTGAGTHDFNFNAVPVDSFDPSRPTFLMYDGDGPDAHLVSMAFMVITRDGNPPQGFAGANDQWHSHEKACIGFTDLRVLGVNISDDDCFAKWGYNIHGENLWMTHLWVVPGWEDREDVFADSHPCLTATGPAPATDPCWIEARSAPAPAPAMTDHGEH